MAAQLHVILTQALDANAKPISGAKWKFYVAGTTTPLAVYEDSDLENSLGSVVTADSAGVFPPMFYDAARSYRGVLCDAAGTPLPDRDFDPINPSRPDAGSIVWTQNGDDAIASTVDAKLKQALPTARDWGAPVDGVTDARAALVLADAAGAFMLTPGLYYVSASVTLNNLRYISPAARLVVPNGVLVTAPNLDAGDYQIVNATGTGNLAGLAHVRIAWFAGDLRGTLTDARASLQKALNACATGAEVQWDGFYASDGSAYIEAVSAQSIVGMGYSRAGLVFTTAACLGISLKTTERASVNGLYFKPSSIATIPTSGACVLVSAPHCVVEANYSPHCYIGVQWEVVNTGKDSFNDFNGATYSANFLNASLNIHVTNASGSAFTDWFDLSTTTGFIAGESVTFSGGGTGAYGYTCSPTRAKVATNNIPPVATQTMTGVTSGTVATVTAITYGHQGGGLRMYGNAAGCIITGSAWSGGKNPGVLDGPANAHGSRPEYGSISGCFFDFGTDDSLYIAKAAGMSVTGTWASSRAKNGIYLGTAISCLFSNNKVIHSWENGFLIAATSKNTVITGNDIGSNNRSGSGKSGVYILANTTDFVVTGNNFNGGTAAGFDGTNARPVIVEVGASDRYTIKNNLVSGCANPAVSDGGTGVNKAVGENY